MKTIAIFYGSSTGNTKDVAESIRKKLNGNEVLLIDVAKAKVEDFNQYNNLILGTSTWGMGDLQDDWDAKLSVLAKASLEGKTVALFGLGDSSSYADTFVDGMGIIYEAIKDKQCNFAGFTDIESYSFSESRALHNGKFVGLPIDEENQGKLTESRLNIWVKEIEQAFI